MKKWFIFLSLLIITRMTYGQWTPSLSYYADKCNIKIGTAVGGTFYSNFDTGSTYDLTIKNNFNTLVAENEMKWDAMEPSNNSFNFTKADQLTSYAFRTGKQVRGHNLCWHSQLPGWISTGLTNGINNGTFTRASLTSILKNHITTIMTRYKGLVQQWDVLNEPFNDSGGTLRNSIWQQVIGNDYIDSVFVWAHRADPTAKLYLNDYGVEFSGGTKADAMYNYVSGMKSRNIPITGVGLQCHFTVSGNFNVSNLDANIKRYAALGLEAIITELDIKILKTDYTANSTLQLNNQAECYRRLIRLCLDNSNCKTFMTWGFTDLYSWIPGFTPTYDYSLLFDTNYAPKPAYTSILNELAVESQKTGWNDMVDANPIKIQKLDNRIIVSNDNPIARCQLFDMQGKCIFVSESHNSSIEIPSNKLKKSIYILKLQLESGRIIVKKFPLST
jgi:endo-1,4-beta-xylanase